MSKKADKAMQALREFGLDYPGPTSKALGQLTKTWRSTTKHSHICQSTGCRFQSRANYRIPKTPRLHSRFARQPVTDWENGDGLLPKLPAAKFRSICLWNGLTKATGHKPPKNF